MIDMIVDGNSMFARSWFAAQRMTTDPKEAASLMVRTICLLLNPTVFSKIGVRIDRTLFAWDGKQNPLKNRNEKPPEYHELKSIVQDVLTFVFGAVNYQHPKYEGDDIVATAVFAAKPHDIVYIISADKDLQQLEGPRSHYYCLNTKALLSGAYISRKWNVHRPSQVALALAIVGDPVDCIRGVVGYGPVKCKQMFEAVTPDMSFSEALQALVDQMPVGKLDEFYEALDRTLLKTDVPGVPAPAPLRLVSPREVRELGIPNISSLYHQLYDAYANNADTTDSAVND